MESLIEFRQHFGLTQANLANFLSISVSLLKMVEAGKRDLPLSAALAFVELQSFALDKQAPIETLQLFQDIPQTLASNKELGKQMRTLEIRQVRYHKQLAAIKIRYQEVLNRMALAVHLKEQERLEKTKDNKIPVLQLLEAQNKVDLQRFGKQAQQLLQWQIDCLDFSIAHAKHLITPLKNKVR